MLGLILDSLPKQFEDTVQGRVLILDADAAIYKAAATTDNLETAKRRFIKEVQTIEFLAKASNVRLHLTSRDSKKAGRYSLLGVKPYQGNRSGKARPALVEPLRQAIGADMFHCPDNWQVALHREYEADDGVIMDSYLFKESGVVYSEDKDLRLTQYPYLDPYTLELYPTIKEGAGRLYWREKASGASLLGHGPLFFWAQMVMGDTADNIKGLIKLHGKPCGASSAYTLLDGIGSERDAAQLVLEAYKTIDQNPFPEGCALWLYREPEYSFPRYLYELGMMQDEWLQECLYKRAWYGLASSDECSTDCADDVGSGEV